jgi:Peptidase MA superfamily
MTRPRSSWSAARLTVIAVVVATLVAAGHPALARAADPVFGTPSIDAIFGRGIDVAQPVRLDGPPARVELLLRYADAPGPLVIEVPAPTSGGDVTLRYSVGEADGHTLPNTPVEARWRITPSDGSEAVVGPAASDVYDDQRFAWKTVSGDVVRVHWYEGDEAFGRRALDIGEQAIAETGKLLGVSETEPVDFFIYADQSAFYDALGPGTRENVGGQAVASIRTLFALIGPGSIDDPWVGIVVPHELTHLVFDSAVSNPYHFPPRWLNEGVAVYLSQGYDSSDRGSVARAARDGSLIPLAGLTGQFPTSAEQFFLAYAESVSAVDYFIRTHGQDALVALIRSYADGRTDDEAFQSAVGMDLAAFDAAWIADLGADTPVRYGPQPAPAGPQPAAWAGSPASGSPPPGSAATTAPSDGITTSPDPGAPAAPVPPSDAPGSPGPLLAEILVGVLVAIVAIAVALVWVRRRDRRRAAP